MKITKRQLKRIVRESLLREEMLKIISNPHSPETEIFNRIANYALNNDIQGALADPQVNTPDLDLDIDSMGEWVSKVGAEEQWMDDDAVVPDNWDADAVYDFMKDLENAWYNDQRKRDAATHSAAPGAAEREAIGDVFTSGPILPPDIPYVNYQPHRSGGTVVALRLTDQDHRLGNMEVIMDERDAKGYGTTLQAVMDVLEKGGAKLVKKRKPVKYTPPLYD